MGYFRPRGFGHNLACRLVPTLRSRASWLRASGMEPEWWSGVDLPLL